MIGSHTYGLKPVIIFVLALVIFGIYKAANFFHRNSRSKTASNNK